MQEIIFRGKRIDGGEWVTGYYVKSKYHWHKYGIHEDWIIASAFSNGGYFCVSGRYAVEPLTIGQYTGLKDKNGNRIFEGDIISAERDGMQEYLFSVQFGICGGVKNIDLQVGYSGFYFVGADDYTKGFMKYAMRDDICYYLSEYDCYVIGNIHDNK